MATNKSFFWGCALQVRALNASLSDAWARFMVLIKAFNAKMNELTGSSAHNSLGIYTSTYISKDGWPETSKRRYPEN
jgi:hypothetical protein